jgi:hypothetical protein
MTAMKRSVLSAAPVAEPDAEAFADPDAFSELVAVHALTKTITTSRTVILPKRD